MIQHFGNSSLVGVSLAIAVNFTGQVVTTRLNKTYQTYNQENRLP
jgi:hypothetical protein